MKSRVMGLAITVALVFSGAVLVDNSPKVKSWSPTVVAHADTTPVTGKFGTCDYKFVGDVLHIGPGMLPEAPLDTSPWPMQPRVSPFSALIRGYSTIINTISFDGQVQTPPNAAYLFSGFSTLNIDKGDYPFPIPQIRNWQNLETSQTTDMTGMFLDSSQQRLDVSSFDTSKVTSMASMFRQNTNLTSNIVGLTSKGFNTSQVTNMAFMFREVGNGSFRLVLDLSGFDVSQVKASGDESGFSAMFSSLPRAAKLAVNLSNWRPQVALVDLFTDDLSIYPVYQVTLNDNLDLSQAGLAEIPTDPDESDPMYTGRWENKDDRYQSDNPNTYRSAQLMTMYGENAATRPKGDVTYMWQPTKLPIQGKPVTVHFSDESGRSLQEDLVLTGDAGEPYTITPPEIKGYQQVEDPDLQLTGTYSKDDASEVTLHYQALPTPPGTVTDGSGDGETSIPDKVTDDPVARKDRAITAVKKVGFYRTPDFSRKTRQYYYAKQKRTLRPQFVITGVARSKSGFKRYLVRDVTPGSKRYGMTGYMTAKRAFTVHTYYQHAPKQVKVIQGTNAYRDKALKKHVRHLKRGTVLRVKKLVRYHLTTRLVLNDGSFVTSNKMKVLEK
ncbi:DUF5776 domain-containing protein [Levilactobacillus huananensis]|uniref:DUF5776 domain-containing protein n=1 Tax=Levilactobacillus huananensis TaxID=2486019 RepID=UPI000F76EF56|nr:DUF5776 domain-containing protein [Levilactobacillus huananensis]